MKKIFTLFIAFAAMVICTKAQSLLQEGFDDGNVPNGWITVDADGDGYIWGDAATLYGSGFDGHDGACISSASFINQVGALTPDNWLITPAVNLVANATLTFWVAAQDASYPEEKYGVYISTSGTNPSNFTELYSEVLNANGGSRDQGTWKQKTVNLSAYTGQNVYIAFRHYDCTDAYWLNLDDVEISLGTTSIASVENNTAAIYPNPANTVVNVNANANIRNIEIYSISGQKVGDFTADGTQATISTDNMSTGLYLMKINTENGMINKKFSVAR